MNIHHKLLELRKKEKQLTKEILEALQIMERSKAYLKMGYSSLYDYLVRGLGYSESLAYQRQSCVRLIKEVPEVKEKIGSGKLNTTSLSMAFKTLRRKTTSEKRVLLQKIESQPTREVKRIIESENEAPQIKIQKTEYNNKVILRLELSKEQNRKLEKLKALSSHQGDMTQLLEKLIDKSLNEYENKPKKKVVERRLTDLNELKETKTLKVRPRQKTERKLSNPAKNPRYIPKKLRNDLFKKADYKCQYQGCEETHFLQVDHVIPVRAGGLANSENLQVLCSAHNRMKG